MIWYFDCVLIGTSMVSMAAQSTGKWRRHCWSTHSFLEL